MNIAALSGVAARMALTLLIGGRAMGLREVGALIGVARRPTLSAAAQEIIAAGLVERGYGEHGSLLLVPVPVPLSSCQSQGGSGATDRDEDKDKDSDKDLESRLSLNLSLRRNSGFVASGVTESDTPCNEKRNTLIRKVIHLGDDGDAGVTESDTPVTESDTGCNGNRNRVIRKVIQGDTKSVTPDLQRLYDDLLTTPDSAAVTEILGQLWVIALSTDKAPQKLGLLVGEVGGDASLVADMILQVRDRVAAGATITHPFSYILKALRNQKTEKPRPPADDDWGTLVMTPELAAQFESAERVGKDLWGDD